MLFPLHRLSILRALASLSSQSALFNKRFEEPVPVPPGDYNGAGLTVASRCRRSTARHSEALASSRDHEDIPPHRQLSQNATCHGDKPSRGC